jgi:hypothetical protein
MILPKNIANYLLKLVKEGEQRARTMDYKLIRDMIENGILYERSASRSTFIGITRLEALNNYLLNHFGIPNLTQYVSHLDNPNSTRADSIEVGSNSKTKNIRTFKGFLVNCYQPMDGILNHQPILIQPLIGTFIFIYDFESFSIPPDITVVGIENSENFRFIEKQKYLFEGIKPLFVSRYPQNQSKDLMNWLKKIPNDYWHFGDFDFGGLNIYWNEFKVHLHERAKFYLPMNLETVLAAKGNRDLYDNQSIQFDESKVSEINVLEVLKWIRRYKKGLEQEIFIQQNF